MGIAGDKPRHRQFMVSVIKGYDFQFFVVEKKI
jgi:hypothetical protein